MSFEYNKKYFKNHFKSPLYNWYIKIRNKQIKREVLKLKKRGNFLDIGFGNDNLIKLFKNNFKVFGVDISEFAVKQIQKSYKKENFKICDISKEKIPFNEKFDVICTINTIEHLQNPKTAFLNIYYALKPDGIFMIYLPTKSNIFSKIGYKLLYNVKEHIFRPSNNQLKEMLKNTGFNLKKEYSGNFFPLKIKNKHIIDSFNLYFAFLEKQKS